MKKYDYQLRTRLPQVMTDHMKDICDSMNVNESDFVRKSLISELQKHEISDPRFAVSSFMNISSRLRWSWKEIRWAMVPRWRKVWYISWWSMLCTPWPPATNGMAGPPWPPGGGPPPTPTAGAGGGGPGLGSWLLGFWLLGFRLRSVVGSPVSLVDYLPSTC